MAKECPTPEKVNYKKQAAKAALRRAKREFRGDGLHVYRCKCGEYHLGRLNRNRRTRTRRLSW